MDTTIKKNRIKFKHFIITFFNLKIWKEDKNDIPTQTEKWLNQRFELFENYCLPSIKNQSTDNFIWLCLFDKGTPEIFKKRIEGYKKIVPQFNAFFFSAKEASDYTSKDINTKSLFVRKTVSSFLEEDDDFVITTNVDNDYAINKKMIERLQQVFLKSPKLTLLSCNIGLQYFRNLNVIMRMYYPHNHFLTLVEPKTDDIKTIECYGHASARKQLPYIDIKEKPYWLEIVHNHNVSNELRITSRIRYFLCISNTSLSDFGIQKTFHVFQNLQKMFFVIPIYFFKISIWRLIRKLKK